MLIVISSISTGGVWKVVDFIHATWGCAQKNALPERGKKEIHQAITSPTRRVFTVALRNDQVNHDAEMVVAVLVVKLGDPSQHDETVEFFSINPEFIEIFPATADTILPIAKLLCGNPEERLLHHSKERIRSIKATEAQLNGQPQVATMAM